MSRNSRLAPEVNRQVAHPSRHLTKPHETPANNPPERSLSRTSATPSAPKSSSTFSANSVPSGKQLYRTRCDTTRRNQPHRNRRSPTNTTFPSRQIRQGIATNTKGSAYVVYEDVNDAKSACDRLNGFNFQSRYLVVLYHQPEKMSKANAAAAASSSQDLANRAEHLEKLKQQHGVA